LRKRIVRPHDQRRGRAEVARQLHGLEAYVANAVVARSQEQAYFRLSELINRLHGIADDEERASIALLPACRQKLEQVELCKRGVLKFVHENVPQGQASTKREVCG